MQTVEGTPFESLDAALAGLVGCMQSLVPLRVWMVARRSGDDWYALYADDRQREILAGTLMRWPDTLCARMVRGDAPRFAPDVTQFAAYAQAPLRQQLVINAYVGQPLTTDHGDVLGTLCAIDPEPQAEFTTIQQNLVITVARTMSTLILTHMRIDRARQREVTLRNRTMTDSLTGLANRFAWDTTIVEEDEALDAYAENAMVMMIDLDGLKHINDSLGHAAGDSYLQRAAQLVREQLRDTDVVARIGGDEFAVLVRGIDAEQAVALQSRLQAAFMRAAISASSGFAMRLTHSSLEVALGVADLAMYAEKRRRKSRQGLC